jgi:serine/threonine-protein kinase RsbW
VIAVSLTPTKKHWSTMSFASTLYLCPILDLLLAHVPPQYQLEVRLGLQEALVNAAKHGNKLDPNKKVIVQFSVTDDLYSWVITDQGSGFKPKDCNCHTLQYTDLPPEESENGRGLCILSQIFDQVHWNEDGTQLRLCKQVKDRQSRYFN